MDVVIIVFFVGFVDIQSYPNLQFGGISLQKQMKSKSYPYKKVTVCLSVLKDLANCLTDMFLPDNVDS